MTRPAIPAAFARARNALPVLARIDPHTEATIANAGLAALANEVTLLLHQAIDGPERHGLLRLRALALAGHDRPGADLWVTAD